MQTQLKIIKADGSAEEYLHTKVIGAINNALGGIDEPDIYMAEQFAEVVTYYLYHQQNCRSVTSREIFSIIKAVLTTTGYADLERLLAERIPTGEQWARMRANAQWSTFEPTDVWEPGSWTQVVIAGQAEPGWVVRNVTGVQTTHYTENGAERSAVRERTVTVAMRCPAPGAGVDSCRLVLVGGSVLP